MLSDSDLHKAPGLDSVTTGTFRHCAQLIEDHLLELISSILLTSCYPACLKTSLLYPVHKSGSASRIENFRPISLLSVTNRVIEKLLTDQLYTAVEEENLLSPFQFGFRRGLGCEHAALKLSSLITEALDRGEYCTAIFFDVSKAFDSINHRGLIYKVDRLGIGGSAL